MRSRTPASYALGVALAVVVPLAFLGIFFAWPVASLVGRGFVVDGRPTLAGFEAVFSSPRTWRIVGLTLTQATLATVVCVVLGIPGAWVLYRTRFPGRAALRALVAVPFVLPTVVVGVAFKSLVAESGPLGFLGIDETMGAILLALVFFNYSVVVRTVGGLWARLDPRTEEAARTLGASPLRALLTVTLPALAPAIASGATLVFLFCAGAFGVVMVMGGVRYGTVETEIWYQTTQLLDLQAAAALSIVQLVFVTACLVVAGRLQARQERALRLRESADRPWRASADLVPTLVTGAVVVGLLAAPLVSLGVRSFHTPTGWGFDNYLALGTTGDGATLAVPVWEAVATTVRTAVQATALALVLGLAVSFVVSRRPRTRIGRRGLALADAAFMMPLGVSSVTVGFGFLITLNRPPLDLRSSMVLVPIAQAIVALPLVVRTLLPVLRAVDPRLREAAATLGAGPWRVLATIEWPFALRGLGLATGFALATSLGEFGATSFLARPDAPTLPVTIFRLIGRPGATNYGMAMAAAVVLALLTGVVMAAAEYVRPREATTSW